MTFPPEQDPVVTHRIGVKYALPVGTWVTGRNGLGMTGMIDHKGHVFELMSRPLKADNAYANAGYRQTVKCLVCLRMIDIPVDGEWLQEKADDKYLVDVLDRLEVFIRTAQKARRRIAREVVT
jgi:hypothetical protein